MDANLINLNQNFALGLSLLWWGRVLTYLECLNLLVDKIDRFYKQGMRL